MTDSPTGSGESAWQSILNLGEQLMRFPAGPEQRRMILETATRLCGGAPELWVDETIERWWGATDKLSQLNLPPCELMRRAQIQRQLVTDSPGDGDAAHAAAMPFVGREGVLGVLQVTRPHGPAFDESDLHLLRGLGVQCAIALDAARQVAVERWRIDQLTLVRRVSAQVADVLDLDELFRRIADLILSTFGYYFVALFTLEANPPAVRFRASAGPVHPGRAGHTANFAVQVALGEGIIGWVASHGAEIVANAVGQEPRYRHENALPETRAEMALPLKMGDRVLGVLDVQSDLEQAFDATDLLVLHALADTIAVAVEGRQLYDDLRRRADQLSAVAEISRAVTSILDHELLLREVATSIQKRFGYPYVHFFTKQSDSTCLVYRAGSGLRSTGFREHELSYDMTDPQGIIPWAARHAETVVSNDVSLDPRYRPSPLPPAQTCSELAVPLIFGGKVLGVLDVQSDRIDAFSEDDRFLFGALADSIAVALRNADLYRSEQWQRRVEAYASAAVLQVAQAVARLNDLDAILDVIVRTTPLLVGVTRCMIFLWDEAQAGFRMAGSYGVPSAATRDLLDEVYREGEFPLLDSVRRCNDVTTCVAEVMPGESPRIPARLAEAMFDLLPEGAARQVIAVPLAVKADVFGVMVVQEGHVAAEARPKWFEILNDIAQQAALSIQNHRYRQEIGERERMERELLVARAIQQTFMPHEMPGLQGWDLAMAWQPARQVGGDFYDFFDLPGGRLGLVIADVADKGIPAALFMAVTRTLVRAAALQHDSPSDALAYVNDLMVPDAHRGMFVTAVYGVVTLVTGQLVYANAGHLPPLVWQQRAGAVHRAPRGGIALGVLENARFSNQCIDLAPGDCLILCTDGVTDAMSPAGQMYGFERLQAVVGESRCGSAQAVLRAIDASVAAFTAGTPPADDLTLAVLRRRKSRPLPQSRTPFAGLAGRNDPDGG